MAEEKILYFDCFAGISGDMAVAAMLGLGVDADYLKEELGKLNIPGYKIECRKVMKKGISALKFDVIIDGELTEHKHDESNHSHLHSHGTADQNHNTHHKHGREADNHNTHHHHNHEHVHRTYKDIAEIIVNSAISEKDKALALKIFDIVAEAEGKIHGKEKSEVHFHEVGALDSIVDIVGFAVAFNKIGVEKVYCSPLNIGSGFVKCAHGIMPVPAPAVSEILSGVPVYSKNIDGESVTPTGAAIIKAVVSAYGVLPEMEIEESSYGAGTKEFEMPNLLRVIKGKKKTL